MRRLVAILFGLLTGASASASPPLATVQHVDLSRYAGTWYEIAAFPKWFQRGCVATQATYALRSDGGVEVLNSCRDQRLDGKERRAKGKAWIVDRTSNAKLKVQFFWPFRGDYWIVALDPDYRWSVVGDPTRTSCWILSRSRHLDDETLAAIFDRVRALGFDPARLVRTVQPD
ncbi:MAG TPA: lipocalin family protein [Anaeromyxobacteraceae bacterium]|nr:lipocalin family protein [Anaeromyxobacteraceae bacterium]